MGVANGMVAAAVFQIPNQPLIFSIDQKTRLVLRCQCVSQPSV
jgi:hypothetical protein